MPAPLSVIATVKNEASSIHALLDSLRRQTRAPDEIIVVDGGSTDDTLTILQHAEPFVRTISAPGTNISEGRNIAIRAARYDLILVTDAGVSLPDTWVECLYGPLARDESVAMVGGFFESAPESLFEWALGSTTLPLENEIDPDTFMPSHRSVAFRRSVWKTLGGYPEWLDYCEDLLFDMRLRAGGHRVIFEPRATVAFRPRATPKAFAAQYFRYARGDGKARILVRRHLIRYAAYSLAIVLQVMACRMPRLRKPLVGASVLLSAAYCRRPWLRLHATRARRSISQLVLAAALVPFLRFSGDVAKMIGFPVGLVWSARRRIGSR